MDEETLKAVKDYLKDNLSIKFKSEWGHFEKLLTVELTLNCEVISSDSISMKDIREDF